jgi:UDP-glucose 4-epimerase
VKILLIGCGFIGSHFLNDTVANGHTVAVMDYRQQNFRQTADGRSETILGDVRDARLLATLAPEFDCIVNLSGILGTAETVDNPFPSIDTNIMGALNVFEAVRKASALSKKVRCVQITVGNYFMNNSYAITKHCAERLALMYNKEHGTQIAVVRALNAYGPAQKHKPVKKVIPNFSLSALKGQPISIYGSGNQIMDMIFVGDVVRVLQRAAFAPLDAFDSVFEAGTGRRTTINDIADQVLKYTGSRAGKIYSPMRAGEPPESEVIGNPNTLNALGVDPASLLALEQGLPLTIAWYENRLSQLLD